MGGFTFCAFWISSTQPVQIFVSGSMIAGVHGSHLFSFLKISQSNGALTSYWQYARIPVSSPHQYSMLSLFFI
jgi:hypothetical protein